MPIGVRDVAKPVFVKECFYENRCLSLCLCADARSRCRLGPSGDHPPAGKSIIRTTCADYLALDETFRPKFIYYAVGHSRKGSEAVLDVAGIDRIQPQLEEYCKVNLTKSAYEHVMKTSIASEKTNR